jgi:hypothetical protein
MNRQQASNESEAEVERLLAEACAVWRQGGEQAARVALECCDEALRLAAGASPWLRARVCLKRGQILESGRTLGKLIEARQSHEAGLAALGDLDSRAHGACMRLRAQLWMNRGNALLAMQRATEAREAVRSFDQALALLENDDADREWNKLADAGERAVLDAMIGAAWLNRAAAACLGLEGADGHREQGRCLRHALERLSVAVQHEHETARRNLAGAWLNLGAWHEVTGDREAALNAWRECARVAAPAALRDPLALDAALRARHALCLAQGRLHAEGRALDATEIAELFAQVEEGLADYEAWNGGAKASEPIAARLFEFGAWCFQRAAPERLADFLRRNVGADDGVRLETARVAAEFARQEILRSGFSELTGGRGDERRARLRELSTLIELFATRQEACRKRQSAP